MQGDWREDVEKAPYSQAVLIWDGKEVTQALKWRSGSYEEWTAFSCPEYQVWPTHWMPLPDPPKKKSVS